MEFTFFQLLFLGFAVALANVLGGLVLSPSGIYSRYKKFLKYILSLGAGFMLAVVFIEILPKTIEIWQDPKFNLGSGSNLYVPMVLLLAGYLLTQFFEHTIAPHFHLGEEVHSDHLISASSAYTAIGGLLIHAFFDGVSISAAYQVDSNMGILVFLAVFLHKFPEGFTIASMVLATGKGSKEILIANTIVGLTTFLGVMGFYFIGANLEYSVAYALPIAGGVTLYVAASDLIPEVNHHGGKNPIVSLSVFAGVAVFFAFHILLHEFVGH